jgi:hypothetical protein
MEAIKSTQRFNSSLYTATDGAKAWFNEALHADGARLVKRTSKRLSVTDGLVRAPWGASWRWPAGMVPQHNFHNRTPGGASLPKASLAVLLEQTVDAVYHRPEPILQLQLQREAECLRSSSPKVSSGG